MATQREVARAFFRFEDSPRRASNFRIIETDNYDALTGGRNAKEIIYAKRQPLRHITFWRRQPRVFTARMGHTGLRDQHACVHSVFSSIVGEMSDVVEGGVNGYDVDIRRYPPEIDEERPELLEAHPSLSQ